MFRMRILLAICALLLAQGFQRFHSINRGMLSFKQRSNLALQMSTIDCKPGAPVVKRVDQDQYVAYMTIALSPDSTQRAFNEACELFNEVSCPYL